MSEKRLPLLDGRCVKCGRQTDDPWDSSMVLTSEGLVCAEHMNPTMASLPESDSIRPK